MTAQRTRVTPAALPVDRSRRTARVAGALYLLTFVTSIPTLALYAPLRDDTGVLGGEGMTRVLWGAALEVGLAITCVGTAVALLPVIRRHSETAALGFLASRVVEAGLVLVGVASVLAVVGLHREAPVTGPATLAATGQALLGVYDGTFLLGQSLMPVISALCLGSVLYRSRLVPRLIPAVGLAGAPLLLASDMAILFGVYEQGSALAAVGALPIAAWELALGIRLVTHGFGPAPALPGATPLVQTAA